MVLFLFAHAHSGSLYGLLYKLFWTYLASIEVSHLVKSMLITATLLASVLEKTIRVRIIIRQKIIIKGITSVGITTNLTKANKKISVIIAITAIITIIAITIAKIVTTTTKTAIKIPKTAIKIPKTVTATHEKGGIKAIITMAIKSLSTKKLITSLITKNL